MCTNQDDLHPGEAREIINGYTVYIGGTWYEISAPGKGVILYGNCYEGMTPRQVYNHHFPADERSEPNEQKGC